MIDDNGDKLRPNQYPLGATQRIEQPRMARMNTDGHRNDEYQCRSVQSVGIYAPRIGTDEQAYTRACARDLYIRCIHLIHSGHTIYDKHKK